MSLHTTTTALFSLTKYSRSYGGSATHSQLAAENEWQHFTNPVMKLLLEVKKSPSSGELLSLRLRILWCIDMQAVDTQVDQREVVFVGVSHVDDVLRDSATGNLLQEDLELLSFSSLSASRAPNGSEQGLPLRAVYRDAVVGIRYLHPKTVPPGCQPVYRRFQVTFGSILEASQFIDTIKPICPCKPNAQPNQMTRNSTMLARAGLGRTSTISDAMPSERPMPPNEPVFKPATNYRSMTGIQMSPTRSGGRVLVSRQLLFHQKIMASLSVPKLITCLTASEKLGAVNSSNPSLASSSQPHSANHTVTWCPPFVPRNCLALPRYSSVPYNLSQPDLERLISQVVREEGFARLLDGLDALWRAKGFLAR
ncbi:hypothetical protein EDD16DRAFT_1745865 [Pisolithus croceorrhizus]|nr:hypothetical protein EDD16DRAFT_1745865 [Pisolithus croceorrhizus]